MCFLARIQNHASAGHMEKVKGRHGCGLLVFKHYSNDGNNVRLMHHDEVGVLWSANFCTKQSLILH